MTLRPVVNEGSSHFVTVTCLDENGAAVTPDRVTVRVDALGAAAPVRATAEVSPAASFELHVTPAENALVVAGVDREERVVTVVVEYGTGKAVTGEYRYTLRALRFVP